ncbi:MAG: hypothetical protein PHX09_03570 [Clostridia bacterium]|nr:hypothetical protein [Clostridia bacterium]MDD4686387.1 hypothetical protein [Clostridia bacterium]
MKLKNKDVITLNNNGQYLVISTAVFEKENYVYIVNTKDNEKFKIAKIQKNKLTEIPNDQELIKKLIVLFYENSIRNLDLNELARKSLKTPKNFE